MIQFSKLLCHRETEENNMLLKEQFEGMKVKLDRAENRFAEYAKIQLENEVTVLNTR